MDNSKFIVPSTVPDPSLIPHEKAEECVAQMKPPSDDIREILLALVHMFGVHPDIHGIEQVIQKFLPYVPWLPGGISDEQEDIIARLLSERLPFVGNSPKKARNPLIKFHLQNFFHPSYPALACRLHTGVIGKYQQVAGSDNYDKSVRGFLSPINILMPNLHPDDLHDLTDKKKTKANIKTVLKRTSMKREDSGRTNYRPKTINTYANRFTAALFDQDRDKIFNEGWSYNRKRKKPSKPGDSFRPDILPRNHAYRIGYRELVAEDILDELDDVDPKKAERLRNQYNNREHAIAYLDTDTTIANPDKLSLHILALIEHILGQEVISKYPINHLTFVIVYHLLLHTRRNLVFTSRIILGEPHQADQWAVLNLYEGVIYYRPRYYFGRPATKIQKNGLAYYLREDGLKIWASEFTGYDYRAPISALPLPQILIDELQEYLRLTEAENVPHENGRPLLKWRKSDGTPVPFTSDHFKFGLKNLSSMIAGYVSKHHPITATTIGKSFDAYYTSNGLSIIDYWTISEHAKYAFKMPVQYTSRHLYDLAEAYIGCHNQFQLAIQEAADRLLSLPSTSSDRLELLPDLRMGSWHALQKMIVRKLVKFYTSPRSLDLSPQKLTSAQRRHNRLVYKTIFLLGLLMGLRDFEPGRLAIHHINPENNTLMVTGRGKRLRVLPVPLMLAKRLVKIQKTAQIENCEDKLLWVYAKDGSKKPMAARQVNSIFKKTCREIGQPPLDYYSLRHRYRTDLNDRGVPDRIINYLMGHGKYYVRDFAEKTLTPEIWESYLSFAEFVIDEYKLR